MVFTIIVNLYAKDGVEEQLRAKLTEAAQINSKDAGVLGWHPMQSASDSRDHNWFSRTTWRMTGDVTMQ
ncbi:hypothetical protein Pcac1_g20314 [Phytophthora cactorum]|nr:hypothetical protein Pcac1_g20314 [Phytophthora cactorum]KAG2791948.1 hypothetical protein PC112_g24054 [Phytophthora cactorum]